ncbi:MAG: TolB-like translocation protein [Solirubrobacteraceae bacterium]
MALAGTVLAGAPAAVNAASEGSLTFLNGSSVWISRADGSGARQVTAPGFSSPSESARGVLLALGGDRQLHRFNQRGRSLAAPFATSATTASPNISGAFDPVISPDGAHEAYWLNARTLTYDVACGCNVKDFQSFTRWGSALRFDEPRSQGEGQGEYSLPQWIDGQDLVLSSNGSSSLIDQIATYHLGSPANHLQQWFTDNEATQLHAVAISLRSGELAAVADTAQGPKLLLYRTNGPPPALPSKRCQITDPAGGAFDHPTFSPAGTRLAWHEGDGIHEAVVGHLSDCSRILTHLVIPGARAPFWSAAALSAPDACLVPALRGESLGRARTTLAAAGCRLGTVRHLTRHRRSGRVVGQQPRAHLSEPLGYRVTVTLS